jgi:ATP-binding cassette subfamily B protein
MKPLNQIDLRQTISANRLISLWKLMQGYRLRYFAAIISMGLAAVARSSTYLLLGYFVDHLLKHNQFGGLLPFVALGFLALAAAEGGFTFLGRREAAGTSESLVKHIREFIFDHIQRLPFPYHDNTKTGDLIQRATSDVDAVRRLFADQAINAGRITTLFVVNLIFLLVLNWRLALSSVIVIPFVILFSLFFFQRISRAYESFQEQEAVLSSVLQENLSGVRVVKAFARQSFEIEKFDRENWEKYRRGRHLLLMHALFWPTSDILIGAQMLLGFFLGARMAIEGTITTGTYMSFAGMLIMILWPIRNLGQLIVEMSKGTVSYQRLTEVIRENREDITSGDALPDELRGEIIFRDVCFGYEAEVGSGCAPEAIKGKENKEENSRSSSLLVLKNIQFTCKPGQVIALMGSTGSGKTTLATLLPRFYDYTGGSITLDGKELKRYPRTYLRQHIGIVEQEPFLFSRTIRDNIAYGVNRKVSDEEIETAARAAAVHDVILSFPEGYRTLVGEKGVTLSGGQKQRVAIARTLLKNPRILILDDATSSVDMETEAEIRSALENLMQGRTTFIIAHRIQSVMRADFILVLEQGEIAQAGTHAELLSQEGIYRQIFDIQTRIEEEIEKEFSGVWQMPLN